MGNWKESLRRSNGNITVGELAESLAMTVPELIEQMRKDGYC